MKATQSIPQNLQGILWSVGVDKLSLQEDRVYIINQILSFGDLDNIKWLYSVYSKDEILRVFLNHPIKQYSAPRFNFIKNYLLSISNLKVNSNRYVVNTPRDIR
ncbi:hypothetical protein L6255_03235 [Candidatus Parcubacteria bacterium]|nr:hypothetical protein [Patescibacteria group bacterium]MBU4381173.1 hypothetical protein [Patescibacteria group bacterium]MCG2689426.1 hypothetical protein [Candidatus Parcubacteria bacterium]